MNMQTDRPDDGLLSAWLDGEIEGADRERVQAWLRDHPDDAAQVRLWAADRDALRARLASVVDEPIPERLTRVVWQRGQRAAGGAWLQAAMAAGLLLAGALLGATWVRSTQPTRELAQSSGLPWPQSAAVAHAVYAPEVRHPVEVSVREGDAAAQREQEDHLSKWLTRRLALPVKLFDLRAQGFELVGGRLLPDATGPSAQLMYQDSAGQRVTVYLRKPDEETAAAFRYERRGELGLFYWVDAGCGFALVGPQPRERLLALAEAIYHQGQGAPSPAR
jgi:anti-sigma factor RsiW